MSPTVLAGKVTEGDPVRRWRSDMLQAAGYPPWDALVLSRRSDIDLHGAINLLQRGCPLRTALRILI
jgi:hypothetical protein